MARLKVALVCCLLCTLISCGKPVETLPAEPALFAGLSNASDRAKKVEPGYDIQFPKDHASHPEYAIEWWYLTANLFDTEGNQYPIQWTLFRFLSGNPSSNWANQQQFMAHAKLQSHKQEWFEERFARGGVGNAAVTSNPFAAYLDDWKWQSDSSDLFPADLLFHLNSNTTVSLRLTNNAEYVLHGERGYSKKLRSAEQASYYYSQPFIKADGTLTLDDKTIDVSGPAWFDHEWSSQYLDPSTVGWDWFSMHLDSGDKLMLFNMRHLQEPDFWSGTLIRKNGQKYAITAEELETTILKHAEVNNKTLPLHWKISIAKHNIAIEITPFKQKQWNDGLFSYYEGAIEISGTHSGKGFIELTGY